MCVCNSEVTDRSIPQLLVLVEEFTFHTDNIYTDLCMSDIHHKQYYTEKYKELSRAGLC